MNLASRQRSLGPSSKVAAPRWSHESRTVGGIRWQVATIGQGPLAVLVHGTGASSHSFSRLGEALADRFTLLAPDLPGHADSRVGASFEPTLPNLARALAALVDTYRQDLGEPALLIGHSAGAALIARMALDEAVTAPMLVGLGAALVPFRGVARALFPAMAKTLARSTLAAHLIAHRTSRREVMSKVMESVGSGGVDLEPYRRLTRRPDHVAATLRMMASWDLEPVFASLGRIRAPFVLVAGSEDRATPVADQRAAFARLPRGRLRVVPGAGHLVHEEAPETVARLLLSEIATEDEELS